MRTLLCFLACFLAAFQQLAAALNNGVGLTPAMGYNTWNDFRCSGINAQNVMAVADKMSDMKLHTYGYTYINIDDCWSTGRDNSTHVLQPNSTAFPNGMTAVADYVHSKGFRFGMYTDRGNFTCAGRPGSFGYEALDAQTFASWGVDYLKEDSCWATQDHDQAFAEYGKMRDALNKTGRPIYFSLCGWNSWYAPVGNTLGNSWRINGDCNLWPSIYDAIQVNKVLSQYAGPGGWNDADMLVGSTPTGAVYVSPNQSRSQFSVWSMMASPLLIGANIMGLSSWDLQTYTNSEVIALDQDPLGVQGMPIIDNCPSSPRAPEDDVPNCQQVWSKKLQNGDAGVLLINYAQTAMSVACDSKCFASIGFPNGAYIRDLWAHQDLGFHSSWAATLPANGTSATYRFRQTTATASQ